MQKQMQRQKQTKTRVYHVTCTHAATATEVHAH